LSKKSAIEEILSRHGISPKKYFVQVGFDHELFSRGLGHVEEIYLYVNADIRSSQPLGIPSTSPMPVDDDIPDLP
jgi:hypothetical protein